MFAEWSDADTINAILGGGGVTAVVTALWIGLTRYHRQRGETTVLVKKAELERSAQDDKADSDRYDKWLKETRNLIKLQDDRIEDLDAKLKEKDVEIKELRKDVTVCQIERAKLVERASADAERIAWMKRVLKKHGLLSDDDERDYPRTKSDEIDTRGKS